VRYGNYIPLLSKPTIFLNGDILTINHPLMGKAIFMIMAYGGKINIGVATSSRFDLTTINFGSGPVSTTITVIARAEGYRDSIESNAVNYTRAALIRFPIDGTYYQAVDGMTWDEWVNSSYNTGGWHIVGSGSWPDAITNDEQTSTGELRVVGWLNGSSLDGPVRRDDTILSDRVDVSIHV
jgi:hypothetical protein